MLTSNVYCEAATAVSGWSDELKELTQMRCILKLVDEKLVKKKLSDMVSRLSAKYRNEAYRRVQGYERHVALDLQNAMSHRAMEGKTVVSAEDMITAEVSHLMATRQKIREDYNARWAPLVEYEHLAKRVKEESESLWSDQYFDLTDKARKAYGSLAEYKRQKAYEAVRSEQIRWLNTPENTRFLADVSRMVSETTNKALELRVEEFIRGRDLSFLSKTVATESREVVGAAEESEGPEEPAPSTPTPTKGARKGKGKRSPSFPVTRSMGKGAEGD